MIYRRIIIRDVILCDVAWRYCLFYFASIDLQPVSFASLLYKVVAIIYGWASQTWGCVDWQSTKVSDVSSFVISLEWPKIPDKLINAGSWCCEVYYCPRSTNLPNIFLLSILDYWHPGVTWPSGLVHWTQVLVLSECGFESRRGRSRPLCPWARHLTIIASSFGWDVKL